MEYLFDGVKEFNDKDFLEHRELFEKIGREQKPHTLFIGCSDSRVVPSLITKTLPGELFVTRNIANIVPIFRESAEFFATTAVIEYAVKILRVTNIIVCGHSNCGGCNALFMDEAAMSSIPHAKKWLELAKSVKEKIDAEKIADAIEREWRVEQLNIVEQMNHLLTYPYIMEKYTAGTLNIFGWYYIIDTGEIFDYDKKQKTFIKIK